MKKWLLNEFWIGYTKFEKIYLLSMILLQIIVFIIMPDTPLSIIAGIAGVISVVLCAKGKISFYFVGFIQTGIYLVLSMQVKFYGEVIENIFYLVTMVWGIFVWKRNLAKEPEGGQVIKAKVFKWWHWVCGLLITAVSTFAIGFLLTKIGSQQAYLDAATNVLAVIAQLLMIKGYREQWIWWLAINIICVIMWFSVGNYSMVAMYIAWIINCIYGWVNYTKLNKNAEALEQSINI